jgi:hypothetical protein
MKTETGRWRSAVALGLAVLIILVALAAPGGAPRGGAAAAAPAKPTRTPRATATPKATSPPKPTKTPTAVPTATSAPTDTPTTVPPTDTPTNTPTDTPTAPTETPTPTATSCVPTAVLLPTSGDKDAGTIYLDAGQSLDPCGQGLRYIWNCISPDDPEQCAVLNAATSTGDVTSYPLTIAEGQVFSVQLQVCTIQAQVLCGQQVSQTYLGVAPSF